MQKIKIKPLSVNDAYKGRRFKTDEYVGYEEELMFKGLPKKLKVPDAKMLEVVYIFGVSNKNCDNDNPIKPFQDVLQKQYKFNDNKIFKTTAIKKLVPKGEEYIEFEIKEFFG